jgi:hypothetical protein
MDLPAPAGAVSVENVSYAHAAANKPRSAV